VKPLLATLALTLTMTCASAQSPFSPEWLKNEALLHKTPEVTTANPPVPTMPRHALNWRLHQERSKIDDSQNVYITATATNQLVGRFGRRGSAEFVIRCNEGKTVAYFTFANHFMSDIQNYGRVVTRIDKRPARTITTRASTDHSALGLWSNGAAIPFIKMLFGGRALFARAIPFNGSAVDAEFQIEGLEEAISPLRKACRW
jgi:type VI secretion system protein VasI